MPIHGIKKRKNYHKDYGKANRRALTNKRSEKVREQRLYIRKARQNPCKDCGVQYPWYVMDFDHVRGKKLANVSKYARNRASFETIDKEIAKCDLVCANCHRIRTHDWRDG